MGFRLVPKSVTLNDLEWRNGHVVCVTSRNSTCNICDHTQHYAFTHTR